MDRNDCRLHICIGENCNNNCVFCMEEDRGARRQRLAQIDTAAAVRIMRSAPDRNQVMFTAGEPTLREDLPALVAKARSLGFRQIGVVTNGQRLAYADYLATLVESGLNHVIVSIHGHMPSLHDSLTRTPGSFAHTTTGMTHILKLRASGTNLRFATATVLCRRNLPEIRSLLDFLATFGPDERVLTAIQPLGRGDRYFRSLVPRYTDMVDALLHALPALCQGDRGIKLEDVPPCIALRLPERLRGFVERHSHYEPAREILDGAAATQHPPSSGLGFVTKESLDRVLRVKGPNCPSCRLDASCDGVWKRYAAAFGYDELVPAA